MPAPFSRMKDWMIWSSVMPTACILAIFSLAGLEKLHSSMLQVATESLQPHWHCSRAPTRRTSLLGFSAAVCASPERDNATAAIKASRLILNRYMFLGNPHHFRAGILHLDLARNQADQRAADQHQAAHPDPGDQRKNVGLDDRPLVVIRHAREVQVQIFVRPLPDPDLRRALLARNIEAALGLQEPDLLPGFGHLNGSPVPGVIVVLALLQIDHLEGVIAHPHGIAVVQLFDFALVERMAGEPDEHQD